MKSYSGKGLIKAGGVTAAVLGLVLLLTGCPTPGPGPSPTPVVVSYNLTGATQNDYRTDINSTDKTMSGLEVLVQNGSFDSAEWRQGSTIGTVDYNPSTQSLSIIGNPNLGDLTIRLYGYGTSGDMSSVDVTGLTYGPKGSEVVCPLASLPSVYGFEFDSMSRSAPIGEGGFPEFYVQHYTFLNTSGDLRTFADDNSFTELGVDGNKVAFVLSDKVVGFDYANASSVLDLPNTYVGLLDVFKSLIDFESQYNSMHALTPGVVNSTSAYSQSDFDAMFTDVPDSEIRTSIVPNSNKFAYGLSDTASRYVLFSQGSLIHVFGISETQYNKIKDADWLN
ncbi:hypothetical protein JXM83_00280 [Candidatus Woesearchaeota archaeon]|nr:hypothetical protein [Candidatus Woesearchaeota archaeon]